MTFNSFVFVYFFLLVWPAYLCLGRIRQNRLLLVASYVFYGYWDYRFAGLLAMTTIVDFSFAHWIWRTPDDKRRRLVLGASVGLNLVVLGFFKYWNFFTSAVGTSWTLQVLLPVGISFYTFQSIAYVVDVYRRRIEPEKNLLDFALFISFFPQLVAGPIERAGRLLPQFRAVRTVDLEKVRAGTFLILYGYFKKTVVADNLAPFVYQLRTHPGDLSGGELVLGFYSLMFFFYADFSGYSDIARGLGKLFGFELSVNFRAPLFSTSPADFWRRWHITLTDWYGDYVFQPLSRRLAGPLAAVLILTLCGLWHGAAWNFVLFGLYHGILLVAFNVWKSFDRYPRWIKHVVTVHLINLPVVFFMVPDPAKWLVIARGILHGAYDGSAATFLLTLLCFGGPMLCLDLLQERRKDPLAVRGLAPGWRYAIYAVLLFLTFSSGATGTHDFVYFQF